MLTNDQLKSVSPKVLFETYIYCYSEMYDSKKSAEVFYKIDSSNKVLKFIQQLLATKSIPQEHHFITIVNSIPYFLFSKAETLGLGALLGIQKWAENTGNNSPEFHMVIRDLMISTIRQAQKTKINLSDNYCFFDKYFISISILYRNVINSKIQNMEGIYFTPNGDFHFLRFYSDNTVIESSLSAFPSDISKFLKGFNKENNEAAKGFYCLRGTFIDFSTIDPFQNVIKYNGSIVSDTELILHNKSQNGIEGTCSFKKLTVEAPDLIESQVNAAIAKAGSFSIKSAMTHRI